MKAPFTAILLALLAGAASAQRAEAAAVGVAWDPAPGYVTRYVLHYGTSSGQYTSIVQTGLATKWFVTNLNENTRYFFAVQACDWWSCSALSNEVNGISFVPVPIITTDFSGDRLSEITVWRPGSGTWYTRTSIGPSAAGSQVVWGTQGDVPV